MKIYPVNSKKKFTLISARANITERQVVRDKQGHCIKMKESILQEDTVTYTLTIANESI